MRISPPEHGEEESTGGPRGDTAPQSIYRISTKQSDFYNFFVYFFRHWPRNTPFSLYFCRNEGPPSSWWLLREK
jgi:hypothetical protein